VVSEETFEIIMKEKKEGFIVTSRFGFFSKKYKYQIFYNEFLFLMEAKEPIVIPDKFTVIVADKIFNPVSVIN